jgi:hypothetical protein
MRFRLARPEDFEIARGFIPLAYRYSPAMLEGLPAIWSALLGSEQLITAVIEDPGLPAPQRVRGVGLSVFVDETFADTVLADPVPYLNARLHEMLAGGRSPILTHAQMVAANTGRGLTLLPLHFATPSIDVSDPGVLRLLAAAQDMFRMVHAGYRVRRVIKEVVNIGLAQFMESSGMRLFSDFLDTPAAGGIMKLAASERPYLLAADHSNFPLGSALSMMFNTGEARFGFSPAEQKLLQWALMYDRDEEIARDLKMSLDAVRKHWRSICERVQRVEPLFFAEEPREGSRGRGKRRHLLQYLLTHMEELRPYRMRGRTQDPRRPAAPVTPSVSLH